MCRTNSIPNNLEHFLAHEDHVFIGVIVTNNFDLLSEDHQIKFSKAVELQAMVPFVIKNGEWHNVPNLVALVQEVMGVAIKTRIEMYVQEI